MLDGARLGHEIVEVNVPLIIGIQRRRRSAGPDHRHIGSDAVPMARHRSVDCLANRLRTDFRNLAAENRRSTAAEPGLRSLHSCRRNFRPTRASAVDLRPAVCVLGRRASPAEHASPALDGRDRNRCHIRILRQAIFPADLHRAGSVSRVSPRNHRSLAATIVDHARHSWPVRRRNRALDAQITFHSPKNPSRCIARINPTGISLFFGPPRSGLCCSPLRSPRLLTADRLIATLIESLAVVAITLSLVVIRPRQRMALPMVSSDRYRNRFVNARRSVVVGSIETSDGD